MSPDIPPAPPEAEVIRLARLAAGLTAESAAEASRAHDGKGVSASYWRDVERGRGGRRGQPVPVRASERALAAMARVVGVRPAQLTGAGREDAARVLEEILRREGRPPRLSPAELDAALERGPGDYPGLGADVEAAVRPHLEDIRALIRAAVFRYETAAPTGSQIFGEGSREAGIWDGLVALEPPGDDGSPDRLSLFEMAKSMALKRTQDAAARSRNRDTGLILARG